MGDSNPTDRLVMSGSAAATSYRWAGLISSERRIPTRRRTAVSMPSLELPPAALFRAPGANEWGPTAPSRRNYWVHSNNHPVGLLVYVWVSLERQLSVDMAQPKVGDANDNDRLSSRVTSVSRALWWPGVACCQRVRWELPVPQILHLEAIAPNGFPLKSGPRYAVRKVEALMPISAKLSAETRWLHTRATGTLTYAELLAHLRDTKEGGRPELFDARGADTDLTTFQVRSLSYFAKHLWDRGELGPTAVVATEDALFGMVRMYSSFLDAFAGVSQVFRDIGYAEKWLHTVSAEPPMTKLGSFKKITPVLALVAHGFGVLQH